jgi:hypothetical protein
MDHIHANPMTTIRNISTSLSAAATVLLQACSSSGSGSDSGPTPVANTLAPQLVGSWQSNCIVTQNAGSTTTVTSASGGGGGSISGGEAYKNNAIFNQDGRVEFITEYYATSNCNANTLAGLNRYNAVYVIGSDTFANDGSPVTEINISDASSTTYSIFQVVSGTSLYLGDAAASSAGMDGSSEASRYDGLGSSLLKL